jgi:hypothetical protein
MTQYTANVQATSNSSANTDDLFIELNPTSGLTFKVKRIRCGYSDGTATAGVDNHFKIKLQRWDTTTAGSSSAFTAVLRDKSTGRAAITTVKIKNGTTALAAGTGNVETVDIISPNGRALYEFLARDDDDMIKVKASQLFGIVLASPVVSQKFTVSCDWVE